MKKAMWLASLVAISLSANASALCPDEKLVLIKERRLPAGAIAFFADIPVTALGLRACGYVGLWSAVPGLEATAVCHFAELKTNPNFSCAINETINFTTTVLAGKGLTGAPCAGFNEHAMLFPDVAMVLTEFPSGDLAGTAQYHGSFVPVTIEIRK